MVQQSRKVFSPALENSPTAGQCAVVQKIGDGCQDRTQASLVRASKWVHYQLGVFLQLDAGHVNSAVKMLSDFDVPRQSSLLATTSHEGKKVCAKMFDSRDIAVEFLQVMLSSSMSSLIAYCSLLSGEEERVSWR